MGIYLVVTPGGHRATVIAPSASEAAQKLAERVADDHGVRRTAVTSAGYRVGRLGTFEPGIEGNALAQESWPVIVWTTTTA